MINASPWIVDETLHSPLFEPLRYWLERIDPARFPDLPELNALLAAGPAVATQRGLPVRFVAQQTGRQEFAAQYEPRCYLTGEVQTRSNNLHDLFNALVWRAFPGSKAALNARHYQALSQTGQPPDGGRGQVRDMATLFDESGVIVASAESELSGLLADFRWKELFWHARERVRANMGFYIFGHGLYEKAMHPYLGMTGQGLVVQVDTAFFSWPLADRLQHLDEQVAAYFSDAAHCRETRELTPVPLLGVPGWTPENELETYYENRDYFRPGRRGRVPGRPAQGELTRLRKGR